MGNHKNSGVPERKAKMTKKINDNELNSEVASGFTLLKIGASWCSPCRTMEKSLSAISGELEKANIKLLEVDVDESPEIVRQLHIMSVPALVAFKDGQIVATKIGLQSKNDIIEFVSKITKS